MTEVTPARQEYIDALTDITAVFWQAHKIIRGEGVLGGQQFFDLFKTPELFDFLEEPFSPLEHFATMHSLTLNGSLELFLRLSNYKVEQRGIFQTTDTDLERLRTRPPLDLLTAEYTQSLIQKVIDVEKRPGSTNIGVIPWNLYPILAGGADQGTSVSVHFEAYRHGSNLAWPDSARASLRISKVFLDQLPLVRKLAGVVLPREPPISVTSQLGDPYALVTSEPPGVDTELLQPFGYGQAAGCPAGKKPSNETRAFLKSCGTPFTGNMIVEYARELHTSYEALVVPWYARLSSEQKEKIDPRERKILDGKIGV